MVHRLSFANRQWYFTVLAFIVSLFIYNENAFGVIRQLTNLNDDSYFPWSDNVALKSDGSTLYFISNHDLTGGNPNCSYQIFKMNIYNGSISQITTFSSSFCVGGLKISGDGTKLVFTGYNVSSYDNRYIYIMNVDGSGLKKLYEDSIGVVGFLSIDYNADNICYAICGYDVDVYTINADGSGNRKIVDGENGEVTYPKISNDGLKVILASNSFENASNSVQLYIINLDGSNLIQLTNDNNIGWSILPPSLSFDGQYTLIQSNSTYNSDDSEGQNLFRVKTDGTEFIQITHSPEEPCENGWGCVPSSGILSLDGSKVVYNQQWTGCWGDNPCMALIRRNVDGSNPESLLSLETMGVHYPFDLNKDGSVIIFASTGNITGENPDGSYELFAYIDDGVANPKLTISINQEGGGTVKSDPTGISCPYDCEESYVNGATVVLEAKPNDGWEFAYWDDGISCITTNPMTVTMDSAKTLTAKFNSIPQNFVPPVHGDIDYNGCPYNGTRYSMVWTGLYGGNDISRCEGSGGHPGVDITKSAKLEYIYSIGKGTVEVRNSQVTSAWGKYVIIRHDNVNYTDCYDCPKTIYSIYAHLEEIDSGVPLVGGLIESDQIIGKMGNSGIPTAGIHLHFQIQPSWNGCSPFWPTYTDLKGKIQSYPSTLRGDLLLTKGQRQEAVQNVINNTINPIPLIENGSYSE